MILKPLLRIGTAGWSLSSRYREQVPGDGSHLERYSRRLNAVEINSSFYRPHQRGTYERWADSTPDEFCFSVKMPKAITHERRLRDCSDLLDCFLDQVSGLGRKLGVLLVQLPPSLRFDQDVASEFFRNLLPRIFAVVAIEPRHKSWINPYVENWLADWRVARVAADPARQPGAGMAGGWDGFAYYRWHGSPSIYHSEYDAASLLSLSAKLRESLGRGAPTWCIFDNTASGAALGNALELARISIEI